MNGELLRESIDRATSEPTTPPDIGRLKRRGRRRSSLRIGAAALTTLGVVAAGTYAVQSVDTAGQQDTLPASIPANALAFKTLNPVRAQFAGKTYEPDHRTALLTSAMTTAGLVYISGKSNGTPYLMDRSGEETPLGDPVNPEDKPGWGSQIVTDDDRSTAAWTSDVPGPEIQLSLFSAESRTVTDSITFDRSAIIEGAGAPWMFSILTIHDGIVYGTVHGSEYPQSFAWDPSLPKGHQIYATTDPNTAIATVGNDRLVLRGKGRAYGGPEQAPLDSSVRIARLPGKNSYMGAGLQSERLSPDGQWALVDPDASNDIGVQVSGPDAGKSADYAALNLDTGKMLPLRSQGIWQATFDDDGSVLIIEVTPDGGHRLVDCALPSQNCTTVSEDLLGKPSNTTFIN